MNQHLCQPIGFWFTSSYDKLHKFTSKTTFDLIGSKMSALYECWTYDLFLSRVSRKMWSILLTCQLHIDNTTIISCCFWCLLVLILFCLFWTYIWNIQWKWSLYVCILHGFLLSDNSSICKKCCVFAYLYSLAQSGEPLLLTCEVLGLNPGQVQFVAQSLK